MSVSIDLSGRTALVTGSTAGIGFATAEALARAGASVVVNGRNDERVTAAVKALTDATGGEVAGAVGDVGTAAGAEAIFAAVPELDVLVNNAGIFEAVPFFDIPDEEWQRYFDVNVLSGIRLARHYAPGMVERGWGRVIFVSSESAVQPPTEMVHYGMTKTAQLAVSRGLAQTVAGSGVTVNSVLPGPTLTDGVRDLIADRIGTDLPFEEAEARFMAEERPTSLLRRLIRPAEIGNFIAYVASDLSSATTGAALRVDGGAAPTLIP